MNMEPLDFCIPCKEEKCHSCIGCYVRFKKDVESEKRLIEHSLELIRKHERTAAIAEQKLLHKVWKDLTKRKKK